MLVSRIFRCLPFALLALSFSEQLTIYNWFPRLFEGELWRAATRDNYDNYYVSAPDPALESQRFFRRKARSKNAFKIIWNVPTFQCHKYGLNFSDVAEWGIVQNYGDEFRGNEIALLYDPGLFPALLEGNTYSESARRNGGVPQEGNLTLHLDIFRDQITNKLILDENFSGIAVIDFEHWRPIWEENFGSLSNYKKVSKNVEQQRHPIWPPLMIEQEAERRFEKAGWEFMLTTLKLGQQLRPKALWGYYGFPLCFNYTPKNNRARCSSNVQQNNERTQWLFEESGAIYPSLYYKKNHMSEDSRGYFMKGRLQESKRVARMSRPPTPIYPYVWLKYYDTKEFVSENDLVNSLALPKAEGASGVVIWGATKDVNSERKCQSMRNYVQSVLGPVSKRILQTPADELQLTFWQFPEKPIPVPIDETDILDNTVGAIDNFLP